MWRWFNAIPCASFVPRDFKLVSHVPTHYVVISDFAVTSFRLVTTQSSEFKHSPYDQRRNCVTSGMSGNPDMYGGRCSDWPTAKGYPIFDS